MKVVLPFLAFLFFVFGCGTTSKSLVSHSTKEQSKSQSYQQALSKVDSLISKETTYVDTAKVKAEQVNASVSVDSLNDCKSLYEIIDRLNYELLKAKVESGTRAGVEVKYDTITKRIYIKATCDSSEILSLRKYTYELRVKNRELETKQADTLVSEFKSEKSENEVKSQGFNIWNMMLCGAISILIGIIIGLIIKTFYL